jgi:ABC-type uncharacterized transport system involved in gliding motility auxiliary subunit
MKFTWRFHQQQRLKTTLTTFLLLGILGTLGWLTTQYSLQTDITDNASNTLSPVSEQLLIALPDEVRITAYIKKGQSLRAQVAQLIDRYTRIKPNLTLRFIDPDLEPEKARDLNIGPEGLIQVEYQGRTEKLSFIDESTLSNALLQLANANEHWVTFLSGHGERSPKGNTNTDVSLLAKALAQRKINVQTVNLTTPSTLPDNTALLIITAPKVPLLSNEISAIQHTIEQGGNILIVNDPDSTDLNGLLQTLGIKQQPGVIVDENTQVNGIKDPSFLVLNQYQRHPITQGLQMMTLFPIAAALEKTGKTDFTVDELLTSSPKSSLTTRNANNSPRTKTSTTEPKPLVFAYTLTRTTTAKNQQRIVVMGDGDFLSNAYINTLGNLDLSLRLIAWLIHEDRFINIPAKNPHDKSLQLTDTQISVMSFGFLIIIPLLLISTGFIIWHIRKRR